MSEQIRCTSCGAGMKPRTDGRVHACEYCGAEVQAAIDADQLAVGLKLDLNDVEAFVTGLANALHGSVGGRTKLSLDGARVVSFELDLSPDLFLVKREAHGIVAQHKKMSRGIALKTASPPLDQWVKLLTKALAAHANENARVAQVLASLRASR
jgi:hypothetical protein